jgi:hypothetical protein
MLAGADRALSEATNSVEPLAKPIASRSLLFAFPSEAVVMKQSVVNFEKLNGRMIGLGEQVMLANVVAANYKTARSLYDVVKRRNLYPSVRFVELDSMSSELQASPNEDALYYVEAQRGLGQWYYTTTKAGKQVFAFDRGGPNMIARTKAFVDAIQVFALREWQDRLKDADRIHSANTPWRAYMRMKLTIVLGLGLLLASCAAPREGPPKLAEGAGEKPASDVAKKAVLEHLYRSLKDPDSVKQFQVRSIERMTWSRSWDGDYEQAWLVCFEYNAKNSYGGYVGLKSEGLPLRTFDGGGLSVVPNVNWSLTNSRC